MAPKNTKPSCNFVPVFCSILSPPKRVLKEGEDPDFPPIRIGNMQPLDPPTPHPPSRYLLRQPVHISVNVGVGSAIAQAQPSAACTSSINAGLNRSVMQSHMPEIVSVELNGNKHDISHLASLDNKNERPTKRLCLSSLENRHQPENELEGMLFCIVECLDRMAMEAREDRQELNATLQKLLNKLEQRL